MNLAAQALKIAWKVVPKLPLGPVRLIFELVGRASWLAHGKGVRQLERNLRRVRQDLSESEIRRMSRAGMVSYMRYYCEILQMPALDEGAILARVRVDGAHHIEEPLARNCPLIATLGHMGNWDLIGAVATLRWTRVTTVAERLKPDEVFEDFLSLRARLGLRVIPLDPGAGVFRKLLKVVRAEGREIVALLADRDLSRGGVSVTMFGRAARVAPGPAALAVATGRPLVPVAMYAQRLTGPRAQAARSHWGYRVKVMAPVPVPAEGTVEEKVAAVSQEWVNAVMSEVRRHPTDWHMLQKVFVEDLDPNKDARIAAGDEQ